MVYEFTQEDYEKRYTTSLRNLFTRTAKHYDGGYLNILSFFVNICQCLRKNDTHLYCPNPCRKPDVCDVSINSNGLCLILPSTEPLKVIPSNIRSTYACDYECVCIDGYVFNNTLKKCIPIEKQCDSSFCFNDGICEYIPEDQRIIQEIQFSCKCPPTWKGLSCSEPRNPCLETQGLCGQHYCYRDPSNVKVGYRCACPPGFKPLSSTQPQCVNMNECVEYPDEACLNVGRCIDKDPSLSAIGIDMTEENLGYTCQCRHGYSGSRCERRAPPLEWTTWSAWTTCSVKCGLGIHKRFCTCPLPNRCIGSYIQTSRCQGPIAYCQDEYDEEMPEPTQSGSKILKSWGYWLTSWR
uniref:EGF-like domain-containing protein n=1 Tax=Trichobilharzia regenti TaxID=157069 RepID=A0AA85KGG1_TRIRE|nr:unnamed protein product [Trichobilharzia regenti]